jgi:hypothetical protein
MTKDINVLYDKESSKKPSSLHKTILNKLGPGIITGASDAESTKQFVQFYSMSYVLLTLNNYIEQNKNNYGRLPPD